MFPGFSEVVDAILAKHASEWRMVAPSEKALAIGTSDGVVHFFTQNKYSTYELFLAPIDLVSVDPTGRYVAALSYVACEVKRLEIPKNRFATYRVVNVGVIEPDRKRMYAITWEAEGKVSYKPIQSE
jgi:hypothetical protein